MRSCAYWSCPIGIYFVSQMNSSGRTCTLPLLRTRYNRRVRCVNVHNRAIAPVHLHLSKGISDAFDELVDQFNLKKTTGDIPSPTPQLRLWILALSNVVSRLERCHSALIEAIVSMPWTTMDTNLVKSYTSFVGMLVSAKPEYLGTVLGKLAHGLTYRAFLPIPGCHPMLT